MTGLAVPQLLALLVAANASAAVARHAWTRRPAPGATGFSLAMACLAVWSLGSAFELVSITLGTKILWVRVQHAGIAFLPLAWLGFAMGYAGASRTLTRRILAVLALEPLLTVVLLMTNDAHRWIWGATILRTSSGLLPTLVAVPGPWERFHVLFASFLLLAASAALLQPFVGAKPVPRDHAVGLLFTAWAPWVAYFLLVVGPPLPFSMDLAPFICTLTGLVIAWGLLRLHNLDLVPSARSAAVRDMPDAHIVIDHRLNVVDLNSAAEEVIGLPASEVVGRSATTLFASNEQMQGLIRSPRADEREALLEWDGLEHNCEIRVSPIKDRWLRLRGHKLAIHDVTPIATAEERYRKLFQQSKDALLIHDAGGRIVDANGAALDQFDYTLEEILSLDITALYPPGARDKWDDALGKTLNEGYADFEVEFRRKDGTLFPAEVGSSLITVTGQHIVQVIVRDITERKRVQEEWKRAKEAAEAASFAKTRFLANMSHEIRTPMNAIIGMTELVLATELDRKQRTFLTSVESSADALMSLLNDILDASKIEAGRLDFDPVQFNLLDCLMDSVNVLSIRAQQKGLALTCTLDDDVPRSVVADPGRLRQIIINLVGNGIKFTKQGEVKIHVSAEQCTDDFARLHFVVSDTGIGIPPEKAETIFDPFIQADNSTTREYGGTGLGLTIVSQLVDLMDGRIWVESEVGKGSVFHFVAELDLHDPEVRGALATADELQGMNALIVDDNSPNRLLFGEMLKNFGIKPHAAPSGADGFDALLEKSREGDPYRLVILDANMPEMDGFDLAAKIRKETEITAPTLMMLTSGGERGDGARCRKLGIIAYLRKPIASTMLRQAILMSLAAEKDENGPAQLITRHSMREARRPLDVLLADDNPVNQDMAVFMLEGAGYRVHVVDNGREAVEALAADNKFDVVLMDAEMPEMDGLEATRTIRRAERGTGRHIPIVAMTAHAMKGDRQRCLRAGMDAYLPKPVRSEKLFEMIARVTNGDTVAAGVDLATDDPPADIPNDEVMDLAAALKLAKGRQDLLARVAVVFLDDYPRVMDGMRGSLAGDDYEAARKAAHRLKGSLGTFAAGRARQAVVRLEEAAAAGNREEVDALVPLVESELGTLKPELEGLCASLVDSD